MRLGRVEEKWNSSGAGGSVSGDSRGNLLVYRKQDRK